MPNLTWSNHSGSGLESMDSQVGSYLAPEKSIDMVQTRRQTTVKAPILKRGLAKRSGRTKKKSLMHGFVDCHCHISAGDFDKDVEEVIENSKKAGLLALLAVAEHAGEFTKIIELSQRAFGLQDLDAALPVIEKYKDRLVGVGEVGLDFTPRFVSGESDKESQKLVLIRQAQVAKELDLPLNVHSRSAGRPTIHLLKEQGVDKALLHAFDGKPSVAMEGVKAGYFFSIPPSIIRSEQKQKLVKQLPLENICLETDSPALGPEKQVRNEPRNICVSAEYISKVKGVSLETVMEVTTQNALRLFPKLKSAIKP
ncbi:hypothetical protein CCH79_00007945 [Gambusia affinis]|uniref:TatD DNase domain containing 3 n=1 Tax=Gambusia affinis TaxID=33528 RepID=A0A315W200_GAMAF|nr:hypothetical protein CCH79_00007945 [Gambusia affinis]